MSQSETGTSIWKGNVSSGNISNGHAIHAREREQERLRRAQQAAKNSMDAVRAPLFGHLQRVKPSIDDPLQKSIKNVLGDLASVMPALHHRDRHQLYGITRVPPTPVDNREQGFIFSAKPQERREDSELATEKRKSQEVSNKHPNKSSEKEKLQKKPTTDSEKGGVTTKAVIKNVEDISPKPPEPQELQRNPSKVTVSPKKSTKSETNHVRKEKGKEKSENKGKRETFDDGASAEKSHHEKTQKQEKHHKDNHCLENGISDKKDKQTSNHTEKKKKKKSEHTVHPDGLSKHKPAKLVMPKGSSQPTREVLENIPSEVSSVEKILAEMTQPMGPPLTGIKTPIKGGHSSFAFPLNGLKDCPSVSPLAKPRKTSECKSVDGNLLAEDLRISDDDSDDEQVHLKNTSAKPNRSGRQRSASASSSSSDGSSGSDSDSSDSDSGSESSDASHPSSPKKSECERSWGLSHIAEASKAKAAPPTAPVPTTKAGTSPPALTVAGDDGLRGYHVAPAPNANVDSSHVLGEPVAQDVSLNALFGSSDGLEATSFCSVSDLVRDFTDSGTQGFDTVSVPLELGALENEELLQKPACGSVPDAQKVSCEQETNSLAVKLEFPKESKTSSTKKQSNSDPNIKREKKQADKVSKVARIKKEMDRSKNKKSSSEKDRLVVTNVTSKAKSKAKPENENASSGKNGNSKKAEPKPEEKGDHRTRNGIDKTSSKSAKDEEEETFVDIESDMGNPLLDGTGLTDTKLQPKNNTKGKPTESKPQKTSSKMSNGGLDLSGHHNSEKLSPLVVSPSRRKNGLTNLENTVNGHSKPDSLLVKIDLALLKRVPKVQRADQGRNKVAIVSPVENGVTDGPKPSAMKIPKRQSLLDKFGEQPDAKKARSEKDLEKNQKSRERLSSASSTGSWEDGHRKRSPNSDSDRHNKRRRHGNETSKDQKAAREQEQQSEKARGAACEPSRVGKRALEDEVETRARCCSCEGKRADKKKDLLVSSFYDEEPRVPYGPDHYLVAAKRLKHSADSLSNKESKVYTYVEAVLNFARCGKALEQNKDTETRSAYQMYSETLDFMRYIMHTFIDRALRCDASKDKRLAGLCMKLQALIYMQMYKLKKDQVMRFSKTLTDYFRGPPKGAQAPSPYNPTNAKMTETPSPMSPTPSPSGSVGSTSSNEAVATPSRSGKLCSGSSTMTSPVNISVPQRIHTMTSQHLNFTNTLLYSHDTWNAAHDIVLSHKDFFMDLDQRFGRLSLHSSMVHTVDYVEQGLKILKTTL